MISAVAPPRVSASGAAGTSVRTTTKISRAEAQRRREEERDKRKDAKKIGSKDLRGHCTGELDQFSFLPFAPLRLCASIFFGD